MKIVVFGATGFIGSKLCKALEIKNHNVVKADIRRTPNWKEEIATADTVVNLAGSPIFGKRWSDAVKSDIHSSRIEGTRAMVEAMGAAKRKAGKPAALVNASAVGYYGAVFKNELNESSGNGVDFLSFVCREWEEEARKAELRHGIRTVVVRLGVVLGKEGGALAKLLTPFNFFLGGPVGNGKQWMSWVHIDDAIGVFIHAIENTSLHGTLNATAPEPKTNKDFAKTLGKVLSRPSFLPLPGIALYALVGEAAEILINGQRVFPKATLASGYQFKFPQCEAALRNLLS